MMFHRGSQYTLALAALVIPTIAGAQGFGLNEIGACAVARGFAVTSAPCEDASSIYWNPAAMPAKQGLSVLLGAASIKIDGDFTRDTTLRRYAATPPTAYVPHLFLNYGMGDFAYGIGAYVPYGLTSQWGDDFPGRFAAKKASLQTVYVQPNISYRINSDWSIGGGPVIGHSTVELIQALDLSSQFAQAGVTFGNLGIPKYTEFARARLKGSAMAYGVNLGIHGRLSPTLQLGIRFLSQLSFDYNDADATFTPTPTGLVIANAGPPFQVAPGTPVDALVAGQFVGSGALVGQKVGTQIRHPAQVQVGLGYTGFENTTLTAEYDYVGWRSFQSLPVNFQGPAQTSSRVLEEDYNNTSAIRLGVEHRLSPGGVALRAGFAANSSAAPPETVTPLLPEMDRETGSFGAYIPLMGSFGLDAAYSHVFTPGSRGRIDERVTGSSQAAALALNNGAYVLKANIVTLSLKLTY